MDLLCDDSTREFMMQSCDLIGRLTVNIVSYIYEIYDGIKVEQQE